MAKEDPEIVAMKRVERALKNLDAAEKARVLRWTQERLSVQLPLAGVAQAVRPSGALRGPAPSITFSNPEE